MEMDAYLDCPGLGCHYAVRFHAPDLSSPPEMLIRAWQRLLGDEHPRHPRPLPLRRSQTIPARPPV